MLVYKARTLLLVTAMLCIVGCQGHGPKETAGTIVGAAAGGILGAQFGKGKGKLMSTALGAVAGAWFGGEIGKSLDDADKAAMQKTTQYALESNKSGKTSKWSNPDSGNSGSITPIRTRRLASNTFCREYQQTITVGNKTEQAYGTACRQPDGSWKIRN
tara:strand:- start:59 stop:535 length:477 start_codon:yes stop_codon:yes gene_type:complete